MTPLEWHVLEQHLGKEVVGELRRDYNKQLQIYQKARREKALQRRKEVRKL